MARQITTTLYTLMQGWEGFPLRLEWCRHRRHPGIWLLDPVGLPVAWVNAKMLKPGCKEKYIGRHLQEMADELDYYATHWRRTNEGLRTV